MTSQHLLDAATRWLKDAPEEDRFARKNLMRSMLDDRKTDKLADLDDDHALQLLLDLGCNDPALFKLVRPSSPVMDSILGIQHKVLDHGFVRVIDYMGDEPAIAQAARVSYGKGTKAVNEDRGLIRYLMRHRHTTPFEMCEIKLHCKMPIFVARQWVRHRTANINEASARYSILDREFYVPEPENVQMQSTTNRQGRGGVFSDHDRQVLRMTIRGCATSDFDAYESMIDEEGYNLSRELGRVVLPLSTYTQWYWKIDLHNLLHFLSLRADPHAQYEIRVYADIICAIVSQWCPAVFEAFEDYVLHACTFSRQEMAAIRESIQFMRQANLGMSQPVGLSDRERAEFERKLVVA